ncbi:hypothetical protein LEP1GSC017_1790 [Leptospira meyeri serovar Hardjo str. Went 5]|nr:hypothetical protein LEP1GSC017_1790 [Leptospira meyeri serovar Hardjo str. Went 5]EMJ88442.1 hypothetical protein LEP1GSC196_1623 [Leptospira meyeri serovar Semaranga str. Veldrot Semarang 173]
MHLEKLCHFHSNWQSCLGFSEFTKRKISSVIQVTGIH